MLRKCLLTPDGFVCGPVRFPVPVCAHCQRVIDFPLGLAWCAHCRRSVDVAYAKPYGELIRV